ncbi:MAG: phenylacetate--CoA ligase [Clostridiales bacterium]|jgi:phenylacetate-CoA ligase|nr:phenylacetate--CoA ligase [Clostridiales bacterium]
MPIYDPAEVMPREELTKLQSERLVNTVKRVYENVAPYREKMDIAGVRPEDIRSIEDIVKLPFTSKTDLRDNYPYGLFAVPLKDVVRVHASSGTTGKQIVVGYTREDLKLWGNVMARTLSAGGITSEDIGQCSYGYGLFTGGLGGNIGCETIGCVTIPASTGNTSRQVTILQDFMPTFILCTPSYALTLAEYIEENNIPLENLHLKVGFFGAEPWTEGMRAAIERRLNLEAYDIYGLSEVIGPGVGYECSCHNGLHISEDHFYLEIVDPDTGEVLPDGEMGEVVFTCLTKQALPFIRYRTHDIGAKIPGDCPCGRTLVRLSKLAGRSDDMLIIRGVNVFPTQIEDVLTKIDGIAPHYQVIVDRKDNKDSLTVLTELNADKFTDEVKKLEELHELIRIRLESTLGIGVRVKLMAPKSLQRSEGKAVHVIDNRKYD